MKVLHVKKYNALQISKYSEDYDKWSKNGGFHSRDYPPQSAFYGFFYNGNYRMTGYVAFNDKKAILRSTKREAIADFNR